MPRFGLERKWPHLLKWDGLNEEKLAVGLWTYQACKADDSQEDVSCMMGNKVQAGDRDLGVTKVEILGLGIDEVTGGGRKGLH